MNLPYSAVYLDDITECCQKCAKYGLNCHTYCKFGIYEPYLLQIWQLVPNLAHFWQRHSGSAKCQH